MYMIYTHFSLNYTTGAKRFLITLMPIQNTQSDEAF